MGYRFIENYFDFDQMVEQVTATWSDGSYMHTVNDLKALTSKVAVRDAEIGESQHYEFDLKTVTTEERMALLEIEAKFNNRMMPSEF